MGTWDVFAQNKEVAALLLENGADVNAQANSGWTALHYASRDGLTEAVELLLDHGADVTVRNNSGYAPLYYAARRRHVDIVELLRLKGAGSTEH